MPILALHPRLHAGLAWWRSLGPMIVAIDDVAMRINEPGHHGHAPRVDPLARRTGGRWRSGRDNLSVPHHDGTVGTTAPFPMTTRALVMTRS